MQELAARLPEVLQGHRHVVDLTGGGVPQGEQLNEETQRQSAEPEPAPSDDGPAMHVDDVEVPVAVEEIPVPTATGVDPGRGREGTANDTPIASPPGQLPARPYSHLDNVPMCI